MSVKIGHCLTKIGYFPHPRRNSRAALVCVQFLRCHLALVPCDGWMTRLDLLEGKTICVPGITVHTVQ